MRGTGESLGMRGTEGEPGNEANPSMVVHEGYLYRVL